MEIKSDLSFGREKNIKIQCVTKGNDQYNGYCFGIYIEGADGRWSGAYHKEDSENTLLQCQKCDYI